MTDDEALAEIRSIASDLAIRSACPGDVSGSLQFRVADFLHRSIPAFNRWQKSRRYLTKMGTAIVNGKQVPCWVSRAVVDDTAGELCRSIAQNLALVNWKSCAALPSACKDWTDDRAEQALREAAAQLPELCDRLEQVIKGVSIARPAKRATSGAVDPFAEIEEELRQVGATQLSKELLRLCWSRPSVTFSEASLAVSAWHNKPQFSNTISKACGVANKSLLKAGILHRVLGVEGERICWK